MTESLWQKPSRGWPTPQDPTRIEARFKNGSVVVGSIYWDVTDDGYPTFSFELDDNTFGDISQVVEYRELPI